MFMSESDEFSLDTGMEVWREELVFGSWEDGANRDGSRETSVEVAVPDVRQGSGPLCLLCTAILISGSTAQWELVHPRVACEEWLPTRFRG